MMWQGQPVGILAHGRLLIPHMRVDLLIGGLTHHFVRSSALHGRLPRSSCY